MTPSTTTATEMARRNTEIVLTAMRELFIEKDLTALDRYWAERAPRHRPAWLWREARRQLPGGWLEEWDRKISAEIEVSVRRMDQIDYTPWSTPWRPTGQADHD